MAFEFTPSQERAISDRGGEILVSAAAGSGKTRVLTERLLRRVTDGERPVDIDRFLVITYTRAAAAELRERILTELGRRAAGRPEDSRLRRQQTLCCRANIGTIHSFCSQVVRENCHTLGISPAFTVLEEDRAEEIRGSVLTLLLEKRYEQIDSDPDFRLLTDTVGAGRDDRRLEEAVADLHEKLRSQPWPEAWAEQQKRAMESDGVTDASETLWGRELMEAARSTAAYWAARMEDAVTLMHASDAAIRKAYIPSFSATAEALRDFLRALDRGWDAAMSFSEIPFPRLGALRNYDRPELKEHVAAIREGCKKASEELRDIFAETSAQLLRDVKLTAPAMRALLDLALELDSAFSAEKRRRSCLDFSDLEHCAAELLTERGTGAPTELAGAWASRFEEVMVDEYQDVSPLQDLIFRAVSRSGKNLFLVGDVKQSIYRFRLADPTLFLKKYRSYVPVERAAPGEPRRILLQENFRSRKNVLEAANAVFSSLMSEGLGELDYDRDAALKYGAKVYQDEDDAPVELAVIEASGDAEGIPPEKSEREAHYVAQRILDMMRASTTVSTPEGTRTCEWRDFVLLLRSPAGGRGALFRRVLTEYGIPVEGSQGGGFFTSLEITVAVNLLSLTDNPHADIPLISVLRSPVFALDPDALSAIRAGSPDTDFYTAVRAAAARGDEACARLLRLLGFWRVLAPDLGVDELLWRICSDTELFAVCSAMRDGEARRRNLTRLFEYARSFSAGGYHGLFRFVKWLRRLAERGTEPLSAPDGNAVRIMSIHRSKGLEFPFVFLCGLDQQFNKSDARDSVLLHPELGLGPKLVDTELGIEYPTLARRAISRRLVAETLSEELRVLYVAMTRARERLIMTCTRKNAGEAVEKLRSGLILPLSSELLRTAASPARWLVLAALADGEAHLRLHVEEYRESDGAAAPEGAVRCLEEADYERISEKLRFQYPYADSVSLPSKLAATELKGGVKEDEEAKALVPEQREFSFRRPRLGTRHSLTAAERGTATHSFLQYLDFSKTDTTQALETELKRIAAAGHLSPEERAAVDLSSVKKLFASPLGQNMRSAAKLHREFRFTLLVPAGEYYDAAAPEDQLLLQGVVDCWFAENGEITVVDYKTDRVSAEEATERAERYRGQMRAYANALRRITGLPVRRCVLWFLAPGTEVDVEEAADFRFS